MKDIHSHLLYGIDDGSRSLDESLFLLEEMSKRGVTELVLTPHYVENSDYDCNNEKKEELFDEFKHEVQKKQIPIKLYLGNEVFITPNILKLLKNKEIKTLHNSKYLLFEFPMGQIYNNTGEIINELVSNGITPILAHPERYTVFQKHPNMVEEYLRQGLLLQGNFTSLFGKYGRVPEKTLKYFLKKHWITFLGSDTHRSIKFDSKKLEKKLLRITKDKEYVEDLMKYNFDKVIDNEDIGMIR